MSHSERTLTDLGVLVLRAREAKGWGRRAASKTGLGPSSPTTWESVERGQPVQTLTYAGIEKALDWPVGSIQAYLDGGPEPGTPAPEPDPSGLPPRIHEASYDQLYEALARIGDRLPPRIDSATHEQLLDELRRRHEADRAELARRLYPHLREVGAPAWDAEAPREPDEGQAERIAERARQVSESPEFMPEAPRTDRRVSGVPLPSAEQDQTSDITS